jgi:hypothetical protein
MDEDQRERFEAALERKRAEAERRSHDRRPGGRPPEASEGVVEEQEDLLKEGPQDDIGVREKSSGHRQKTADKWNQ